MDSNIAVSHLLKHMLPFWLSVKRDSDSMTLTATIKDHCKYEEGTMALFSLSFILFWRLPVTLNLGGICIRPGNMPTNKCSGNKINYLIFKVSCIDQSARQHTLIIPLYHGEIRLL